MKPMMPNFIAPPLPLATKQAMGVAAKAKRVRKIGKDSAKLLAWGLKAARLKRQAAKSAPADPVRRHGRNALPPHTYQRLRNKK